MSNLKEKRQQMISGMQSSLKIIRQVVDLSAQEIADYIGVSRQTISSIETKKSVMNAAQYISISAILDREIPKHDCALDQIKAVLKAHSEGSGDEIIQLKNDSFIEGWFGTYDELHVDTELIKSKVLDDEDLRNLCENYMLFFSHDVFENDSIESFIFKLMPYLKDANACIYMPVVAIDTIENKMKSPDEEVAKKAKRTANIIMSLDRAGLLSVRGDEENRDLEEFLVNVITYFRDAKNLALFTESEELTERVLSINDIKTDSTLPILVCGVNKEGCAERKQLDNGDIDALEELKKLLSESREDEVDESVTEDEVKYNETSEEDYSELERSKSSINEPTRFIPIERVREGWDL